MFAYLSAVTKLIKKNISLLSHKYSFKIDIIIDQVTLMNLSDSNSNLGYKEFKVIAIKIFILYIMSESLPLIVIANAI